MPLKIRLVLFLGDASMLMCQVPHHRWGIIYDTFDNKVADNLANWLGGIDIYPRHIRTAEHPLTVLISLLAIKYEIAEAWLD